MKYFKILLVVALLSSPQLLREAFAEEANEGNLVNANFAYFIWGGGEYLRTGWQAANGKTNIMSHEDGGVIEIKTEREDSTRISAESTKKEIKTRSYTFGDVNGLVNIGFVTAFIDTNSPLLENQFHDKLTEWLRAKDFRGNFVIDRMDKTGENIFVRMSLKSEIYRSVTASKTDTVEIHATLRLESCDGEPIKEIVNGSDEIHKIYDTFFDFSYARFYNCQFSVNSIRSSNAYDFRSRSREEIEVLANDMVVNILSNGKVIVRSSSQPIRIKRPADITITDEGYNRYERLYTSNVHYTLRSELVSRDSSLVFQLSKPEVESSSETSQLATEVDNVVMLLQEYANVIVMAGTDVNEAEKAQAISHFFDQNGKSIIQSVRAINDLYPKLSHLDQIIAQRTLRTAYEFVRAIERKVKAVRRFNLNPVFRARRIQNTELPDSVSGSVGEELVTPLAPGATR